MHRAESGAFCTGSMEVMRSEAKLRERPDRSAKDPFEDGGSWSGDEREGPPFMFAIDRHHAKDMKIETRCFGDATSQGRSS
jgi:hypothetical protein